MDTKCRDHLQVNSAHRKPSSRCDKKFKLNTHKKKCFFFQRNSSSTLLFENLTETPREKLNYFVDQRGQVSKQTVMLHQWGNVTR